jgi:UDP-N-acetylglucosamine 2-epimerase (non-hydrolysing)
MKTIAIVMGTRPEIIKLAELIRLLKLEKAAKTLLVYTGQHYDYNLFNVFMEELELPVLDTNLGIHGGANEEQVSLMRERLAAFFSENGVDIAVAEGDTNSVLAAALAAGDAGCEFAHVEAGLRSFDNRMPEEKNRIEADRLALYAFAPTKGAVDNLRREPVPAERIFLTGNTIVEAVEAHLAKAAHSGILERLGLKPGKYAVLTAHRQEYVDRKECLEELLLALEEVCKGLVIVFPAHPRTMKNLAEFGLLERAKGIANMRFVEPLGYFEFLKLASNAMFLLSDSGGIHEEASIYKKRVIIMRDSTERPEILGSFGVLTGYNADRIVEESRNAMENYAEIDRALRKVPSPFGDGRASQRIAKILLG